MVNRSILRLSEEVLLKKLGLSTCWEVRDVLAQQRTSEHPLTITFAFETDPVSPLQCYLYEEQELAKILQIPGHIMGVQWSLYCYRQVDFIITIGRALAAGQYLPVYTDAEQVVRDMARYGNFR